MWQAGFTVAWFSKSPPSCAHHNAPATLLCPMCPNRVSVLDRISCMPEQLTGEGSLKGYWWACEREHCDYHSSFKDESGNKGITAFLRDVLIPSGWEQGLLVRTCRKCNEPSLRITYHFPSKNNQVVRALHMVGLDQGVPYIPMMWESFSTSSPTKHWFHFNYMKGKNPFGLNRAAVFAREDLSALFQLYRDKTGCPSFP